MAKISARGAVEVERYVALTGAQYLLRSDGVVLWKLGTEGASWTVFGRGWTPERFAGIMARIGAVQLRIPS